MYFTKNIMNVTGRPTTEILNKISFTHIATCYTDTSRCMASSKMGSAERITLKL